MQYDMLVIGAGPAGWAAALQGSKLGLEVAVVESLGVGTEDGSNDAEEGVGRSVTRIEDAARGLLRCSCHRIQQAIAVGVDKYSCAGFASVHPDVDTWCGGTESAGPRDAAGQA